MFVNSDDPHEYRPEAGDSIHLGDIVGFPIDPHIRQARVVAFLKDKTLRPHERVIMRAFNEHDGDWPTGEYFRSVFLVPWTGEYRNFAEAAARATAR